MARSTLTKVAASVVAACALTLAGCGVSGGGNSQAGGPKPQPVEAGSFEGAGGAAFLKRAASSTAAVTSERMHMEIKATGGPADLSLSADGEFDNAARRGSFTMMVPAMPMGNIESVIDGDSVYLKVPALTRGSKPWMKVTSKDLAKTGSTSAVGDPGAFLKMLEGTGAKITTVGKEDVRGTATTHISTTLDLRKLLAKEVGKDKVDLQKKLDSLGSADLPAVPAQAWIGDDGYVRKFTMSLDLSKTAGASKADVGTVTVTFELYDFNQPVDVKVPDPSQVGDFGAGILGGN
jgi:hypothetical protein